jgi:hypothetical protein
MNYLPGLDKSICPPAEAGILKKRNNLHMLIL